MLVCSLSSEDAWASFTVLWRRIGGGAVGSLPGAHPVRLLRSLEVLTHPLTKDAQVATVVV